MSLTHTVGITYRTELGTIANTTDSYSGDAEINLDDTVAGPSTHKQYNVSCVAADIKSLCIYSDKALTLKTNSTTVPGNTINVLAGKQIVWNLDHAELCPITTSVTTLYVTNAGTTTANLKIRILSDSEV